MQACSLTTSDMISTRSLRPRTFDEVNESGAYIDVVLNPKKFIIRSYDSQGLPLFEENGVYDPLKMHVLNDILNSNLTNEVLMLFGGISAEEIGDNVKCFITDDRKDLTLKFILHLKKNSDEFIKRNKQHMENGFPINGEESD